MASRTSVDQPRRSAYRVYMRSRSPANSADSSPPSPDLTSSSTSLPSEGSRGTSRWRSRSSAVGAGAARAARPRRRTTGPRRPARGPPRGRRRAGSTRAWARTIALSSAYRWLSRRASDWSEWTAGRPASSRARRAPPASWETASNTGAPGWVTVSPGVVKLAECEDFAAASQFHNRVKPRSPGATSSAFFLA